MTGTRSISASMGIWITIIALIQKTRTGVICVCTAFLWCLVFGFMQGKTLLLPAIIMIITLVMGLSTGIYVSFYGMDPVEG